MTKKHPRETGSLLGAGVAAGLERAPVKVATLGFEVNVGIDYIE